MASPALRGLLADSTPAMLFSRLTVPSAGRAAWPAEQPPCSKAVSDNEAYQLALASRRRVADDVRLLLLRAALEAACFSLPRLVDLGAACCCNGAR
jgi:hypothetical protein